MHAIFYVLFLYPQATSETRAAREYRAAVSKAEKTYAANLAKARDKFQKDLESLQKSALRRKDTKSVTRYQRLIDELKAQKTGITAKIAGTVWTWPGNQTMHFGDGFYAENGKGHRYRYKVLSSQAIENTTGDATAVFVFDPKFTRLMHVNYKSGDAFIGKRIK